MEEGTLAPSGGLDDELLGVGRPSGALTYAADGRVDLEANTIHLIWIWGCYSPNGVFGSNDGINRR